MRSIVKGAKAEEEGSGFVLEIGARQLWPRLEGVEEADRSVVILNGGRVKYVGVEVGLLYVHHRLESWTAVSVPVPETLSAIEMQRGMCLWLSPKIARW